MAEFNLIQTAAELQQAVNILSKKPLLAIDLECENNLHHYGAYVSLLQISDGNDVWIIDALKIKDVTPILNLLTSKEIQKAFHDVNFDLRIIYNQWHCLAANIFDTQLAAIFTGEEKLGLGFLLEKYFNIKTEKKFQRVDWTRRPLSKEQLQYAAQDVANLLQLKKVLDNNLIKQERLSWVIEECQNLETMDWSYNEQTYLDIPGAKSLGAMQRSVLQALFTARKVLAQKADRPPFMVFSNKQLLAFSKQPPDNWATVKGVHPLVAESSNYLKQLVLAAKQKLKLTEKTAKRKLTPRQYQLTKDLLELRTKMGQQLGLKGHLIINKNQTGERS